MGTVGIFRATRDSMWTNISWVRLSSDDIVKRRIESEINLWGWKKLKFLTVHHENLSTHRHSQHRHQICVQPTFFTFSSASLLSGPCTYIYSPTLEGTMMYKALCCFLGHRHFHGVHREKLFCAWRFVDENSPRFLSIVALNSHKLIRLNLARDLLFCKSGMDLNKHSFCNAKQLEIDNGCLERRKKHAIGQGRCFVVNKSYVDDWLHFTFRWNELPKLLQVFLWHRISFLFSSRRDDADLTHFCSPFPWKLARRWRQKIFISWHGYNQNKLFSRALNSRLPCYNCAFLSVYAMCTLSSYQFL